METRSNDSCVLCGLFLDGSRRYYAQEDEFVIVESTETYTPVLVSVHGKIAAQLSWFTAVKQVAAKLYGADYSLLAKRSGDHFMITVEPVVRTRDLDFKP